MNRLRQILFHRAIPVVAWVISMCALVPCSPLIAAETPTRTVPLDAVQMTPATGEYYRPGTWLLVRVEVNLPPTVTGVYQPELQVLSASNDGAGGNDRGDTHAAASFISRLPPTRFKAGGFVRLSFWLLADVTAPRLRFALVPVASVAAASTPASPPRVYASKVIGGILQPLAPRWRLVVAVTARVSPVIQTARFVRVTPRNLPHDAALFGSVDLLVLGDDASDADDSRASLNAAQREAIGRFVARGGRVLSLNARVATAIRAAAHAAGWSAGRPFPYVLPGQKKSRSAIMRTKLKPPMGRRIGAGVMIVINSDADSSAGLRMLSGGAAWRKILHEYAREPDGDKRLIHGSAGYDALRAAWPPPPRLSRNHFHRWVLAWGLLSLSAVLLPVVRKNRWRLAAALATTTLILGAGFIRAQPEISANIYHARARIVGQAGANGPVFVKDVWCVTPFGANDACGGTSVALTFAAFPPPRFLAYSAEELSRTTLILEASTANQNRVILRNRPRVFLNTQKSSPPNRIVKRGKAFIFWRTGIEPPTSPLPVSCQRNAGGIALVPETNSAKMQSLRQDEREGFNTGEIHTRHNRFTFRALTQVPATFTPQRSAARSSSPRTPRQIMLDVFATEHHPGDHAVFFGWEKRPNSIAPLSSAASTTDLGTLHIQGLHLFEHEIPE